jgi:type VI secretion system ImpH/TssG family protein
MMSSPAQRIRQEPRAFSFPQWIRIWLREHMKEIGTTTDLLSLLDDGLDIHHSGSIGFAPQDISELAKSPTGRDELRVHFMGLQGASSPLPAYMIDPLQKSDDRWAALRGFYNIFENRTYRLFALATLLRSPWIRSEFTKADPLEKHLRLWAGCLDPNDPNAPARRLGSFSQLVPHRRSKDGLRRFLAQQLNTPLVEVDDSAVAWIGNPAPASLGESALDGSGALGTGLPLGGERLEAKIGPLPWESYRMWALDRDASTDLVTTLIEDFLPRPMQWAAEIELDPSTLPATAGRALGDASPEDQARLGSCAWLGTEDPEAARMVLA